MVGPISASIEQEPQALRIVSPKNNLRLIRNPELPADLSSLALTADVEPDAKTGLGSTGVPMTQVLWYVDGKPFQLGTANGTVRWPLQAGLHVFQAKVPYSKIASAQISVQIQ
jgi:penicillin-binding protein 1C